MIERALITAGVVIIIIGAFGKIGEGVSQVFTEINCTMSGGTNCPLDENSDSGENEQNQGTDTRSTRRKSNRS